MGAFIVKLEREELNRDDSKMLNLILHSIGDLERISDHAKNISETAAEMDRKGAVFSQEAQNEVQVYMDAVREIVQMATDAFSRQDAALASNVEPVSYTHLDVYKRQAVEEALRRKEDYDVILFAGSQIGRAHV